MQLRARALCVRLLGAAALLWLAGCSAAETPGGAIAPGELAERLAAGTAPLVLDVRTTEEYAAGHVPGALNIPHTELASRLDELPVSRSTELVVHCQRGGRAAVAESLLVDAGYTNVRDLDGHMEAWQQGGYPLE